MPGRGIVGPLIARRAVARRRPVIRERKAFKMQAFVRSPDMYEGARPSNALARNALA